MHQVDPAYQAVYAEHEGTRLENDRNLLPGLHAIRTGEDLESLARFAKAYLGMFLDIDNNIPSHERIYILANKELAEGVKAGFGAVLDRHEFPDAATIADSMLSEEQLPIGYVLLAALDLYADDPRLAADKLPVNTLHAAICFHYAYKTEMQDKWFAEVLLERQSDAAQALSAFWLQLIAKASDHLPGLYHIISHSRYDAISAQVVLPVLRNIRHCRKAVLRDLLHAALRVADHEELYALCETALDIWPAAQPAYYIPWLATAFLLHPDKYAMLLTDYCGRSKEKILPLLDFAVMVLMTDAEERLHASADTFAQLLRIIAPKFTPQQDRYGNPCDNTQKVMYLFYRLATATDADAASAIRRLGKVRVMKLYKEILDLVAQTQAAQTRANQALELEDFIEQLHAGDLIKSRKKWSDLGH